ncbi:alpha/beta fold hydrolase [Nonomuraea soli]|uniref:Pimeloyl-ACP methyl ester carboxylesterase n=1 Tax=Nonomuraea soli TaxID=1032476 RepID=A0A7W0CGU3_9ACTN|nr:alpha/beta hydrolase [Nonomuraea soli]MBA2890916.1 pimeloyl-ACP methyl ester carboxylesterase [Nonomuraea soli]
MTHSTIPTVVLVHGAFADAAAWSGVITELQQQGIPVLAPPNPLRGLAADAAYIASVTSQIDGPVILAGHSYGGAVITVAGAAPNVVGLVYVAAYVPDQGESLADLQGRFPEPALASNLRQSAYPGEDGSGAAEFTIAREAFPQVFAADLPEETTRVLAVAQRPLAAAAFTEPASTAAWRTKPAWAVIADADQAINPDVQRFGAARAGAGGVEVAGASHAVAVSRPKEVADVLGEAFRAVTA